MDLYSSPFLCIDRAHWSLLYAPIQLPLTEEDIARLRGLNNPLTVKEVRQAYLPLSQLIYLYFTSSSELHRKTNSFLASAPQKTPFIIGIAGSVAAGKSTVARLLRELLSRWPSSPDVRLVTTDGFLYPQADLERRGLANRKGFPESYDQRRLLEFVHDIKSGKNNVRAPWYSHERYDILPHKEVVVNNPDILIIEGLNVLAPARLPKDSRSRTDRPPQEQSLDLSALVISDFFDFSIYIDAEAKHLEKWYVDRFLQLRSTAFMKPDSYFHRYAGLTDAEAAEVSHRIWRTINEPNLIDNILPTRNRADLILAKGGDHSLEQVLLRKV